MTELMGILNLTSDSFSGDGLLSPALAIARIDAMMEEGASLIDVGAESTRPGAVALAPEEEWSRLQPLVNVLGERLKKIRFSIDTRHVFVARKAVAAGFSWINDVSGAADPAMMELAREGGCTVVMMHSLSVPADAQHRLPHEADAVGEVIAWAIAARARAEACGLGRSRIVLDPGIGFGKSALQSLALLKHIGEIRALGSPVLVGHSRKSFLSLFTPTGAHERDFETLMVSACLELQHIDYLRVHDVRRHAALLRIKAAL